MDFWNATYDSAWVLWLIIPWILGALGLSFFRANRAYIEASGIDDGLGIPTWRTFLLKVLPFLPWLAGIFFLIALAGPYKQYVEERQKGEGIDIVMALDLSSSMLAKDFKPNRLEVAKRLAGDFMVDRGYDRIGIVAFSGEAYTVAPLTLDKAVLTMFLETLSTGYLEDGTAIGMGLATAINRLKDRDTKSKIIILLTDGENNSGYISPKNALEIALEEEIRIYTIGVGTKGQAPAPFRKIGDDFVYRMSEVNIDEKLLNEIAFKSGGKYFRAQNEQELEQIYDVIDQLEKSEVELEVFTRKQPAFQRWLILGMLIILVYLVLRFFIFKIVP